MPVDPFPLLRGVLGQAEDAARALIGQERIRLAVTGLSRAGKTVFLTSLIANLLAAGAGRRTLPALEAILGGRLKRVRVLPAGTETTPRFDPDGHLAALADDPPRWPERTDDLSTLSLVIEVERASSLGALLGTRTVTLDLLDYPGEWLLDLPMLRQSYDEWSAATLKRLRANPALEAAARPFLDFIAGLSATAEATDGLARTGYTLYRDVLRAARDRLGMRFLQPGRALNPGPRGEPPLLWFFPLPAGASGPLAALCAKRFEAYLADQRAYFFTPHFERFHRQAVLVDVLGALHAGEAAFADTADALRAIADALRSDNWLERMLGAGPTRIAFVATKADHVPERMRDALVALLADLTGAGDGAGASSHAIAAIRCTEEAVLREGARDRAAVRGVLLENGRGATLDPGEVPLRRPDHAFWENRFFVMPEFSPPRLDRTGLSGLPHLGLDALLAALIGDRL